MVIRLWTWMHWYLLLWLGATSSVLPMCHVHVSIFSLGCEAPYISVIPKISKKSHKFFVSYLRQICKKPSLPSWKIIQQYSFSYSVQNSTLWRKCYFIFLIGLKNFGHSFLSRSLPHDKIQLHLPSKSSSANFQSFCPPRTFVREVLAMHILMSWIVDTYSICLCNLPTPNFNSVHLANFSR